MRATSVLIFQEHQFVDEKKVLNFLTESNIGITKWEELKSFCVFEIVRMVLDKSTYCDVAKLGVLG